MFSTNIEWLFWRCMVFKLFFKKGRFLICMKSHGMQVLRKSLLRPPYTPLGMSTILRYLTYLPIGTYVKASNLLSYLQKTVKSPWVVKKRLSQKNSDKLQTEKGIQVVPPRRQPAKTKGTNLHKSRWPSLLIIREKHASWRLYPASVKQELAVAFPS